MAYDEGLAERVRGVLQDREDVTEKKMFGGLAFLARGHMCVGVVRDELMVRVGAASYDALLGQAGARPMDFTGRPLKGFLYVSAAALDADADLERWVERGLQHATSLPAKPLPARRPAREPGSGKHR